jgi:hypothetical protein
MTPEKAIEIINEVVAMRARWGKQFRTADLNPDILDALAVYVEAARLTIDEYKAELAKANRQVAAANARATKREKQEQDNG